MTIDEKIEFNSWFVLEYNKKAIGIEDAKRIIHEALKKQREICAEVYEDFNKDVPENEIKIINKIKNAPEPEL